MKISQVAVGPHRRLPGLGGLAVNNMFLQQFSNNTKFGKKYLDKPIADVYHFGIQKSTIQKGKENGKNGNDTRKAYAGNKRKG